MNYWRENAGSRLWISETMVLLAYLMSWFPSSLKVVIGDFLWEEHSGKWSWVYFWLESTELRETGYYSVTSTYLAVIWFLGGWLLLRKSSLWFFTAGSEAGGSCNIRVCRRSLWDAARLDGSPLTHSSLLQHDLKYHEVSQCCNRVSELLL